MTFGSVIMVVFDLVALIISFVSLCIVCDEHLVPAVEVFIVQFEVPEEVAAVTLVAFGSAAPELFLNSVSAVANTSDLSLAAILGSGIIAFGLIPPLCIITAKQKRVKLKLYPILRDCSFYLVGVFVFLGSITDGRIASEEACLIILVYVIHTCTVAYMYFRQRAILVSVANHDQQQHQKTNRQSYDLELANSRTHRSEHGKNKRHDDSNNITSRNDNKSMNGSTSTGISPAVTTNHGKRGVAARVRPTIDVSGAAGNSSEYNSDLESGDAWSHTSSPMHEEDSPSRSGCDFFPSVGRQQRAKPLAALIQANSSMLAGNPSVTINSTTSPNVNLIQQSRNESIVLVSDNLKLHDISSSSRSSTGKEEVFSTTRNRKSSGCHNNSRSRSRSSDSNSPPNLFPVDSNDVSGVRTGTNLSTIRLDEEAVASSTHRGPSTLKDVNEEEEGEEEDPLRNVQLQVEEYEEDDIQELEPSTTGDLDIRDVRNRPERRTTHFMGDTSLLGSGSNHSSIDDLSSNIHIYNDNIPNSSIQGHMGTGSQVSVTGSHNNSSTASIQLYSTTTESAIYHFGHQLWLVFHCIYTPVQRVYRILLPSLHPQIPLFITGNVHIVALQNHSSHHRMQEGGDLIHQGGIVDMIESDSDDFDSDGCNEDEPEERQPMLHNMTHTSSNNSEKNRRNSGKKQKNQSKHPDSPVPPSHHNESSSVNSARVPMKRAFLVLFTCILCIGALATAIVVFSEAVIAELGFSSTTVGATFVALGAEIPDAVSAVAMAKLGYYDGAVAGAIGSQVINVSLGVGVPALIVSLLGNGFLTISQLQATSLTLLTCLLIFVIASYITVTVPIAKMLIMGQLSDNTLVYKSGAMFQITIWICVYAVFLYLNSDSNATTDNQ